MKAEDLLMGLNELEEELILEAKTSSQKRISHRRILAAALAAILSASLIGCAHAVLSEADWFKNYFSARTEQALSPGQAAYIEERTQEIIQSVTVNGYTMTVESAIADKYDAYIKIKFEAPSGVVLDAESYLDEIQTDEKGAPIMPFARADGQDFSYIASLAPIEDGNLTDNVHRMMYHLRLNPDRGFSFDDSAVWTLDFHNMFAYYDDPGKEEQLVTEGHWHFDLVFEHISSSEVQFLTEPLPYTVTIYKNDVPARQDVTITSLQLRTMTGALTFDGLEESYQAAGFAKLTIVMKDGSSTEMVMNSGGNGEIKYSLKAPILLEEVDHILLPNGTQLPMPQDAVPDA